MYSGANILRRYIIRNEAQNTKNMISKMRILLQVKDFKQYESWFRSGVYKKLI